MSGMEPSAELRAKASRIGKILDESFPDPPIPLDHTDPFTLLCAVALPAQTTDKKVNEVTPALFARAPTPAALAALEIPEILEFIRGVGLAPTKARHLHEMAHLLVTRHGGQVPKTFEELEALPGVGHKTASVVMTQAFDLPAFPVDTHIHRLAARWGLSDGTNVVQTEADLKALFPQETWKLRHLQIIMFGRTFCPARGHIRAACPVCSWAMPEGADDAPHGGRAKAVTPKKKGSGRRP